MAYLSQMSAAKTLWEFLDTADRRPEIIDTSDDDVSDSIFATPSSDPRLRWKVAATSGIGLTFVIALIAVGVFVFRPQAPDVMVVPTDQQATATDATPDQPAAVEVLLVHVVGAVGKPGVVEVPLNSRVIDAITKAGGATPDASLDGVNLARLVFDGEQIVVPKEGEETHTVGEAGRNVGVEAGGLVSISQADSATLETLPRVGPATAERIIAWREANGQFRSVDDLLAIPGIGPATLEGFRHLITP